MKGFIAKILIILSLITYAVMETNGLLGGLTALGQSVGIMGYTLWAVIGAIISLPIVIYAMKKIINKAIIRLIIGK